MDFGTKKMFLKENQITNHNITKNQIKHHMTDKNKHTIYIIIVFNMQYMHAWMESWKWNLFEVGAI